MPVSARAIGKVLVAQLCETLGDPVVSSPPGSSVHGILQARILKWVAIPFSISLSFTPGYTKLNVIFIILMQI